MNFLKQLIPYLLIGALSIILAFVLQKKSRDSKAHLQNLNYLTKEKEYYKTSDSLNALSIQELNLTLKNYKTIRYKDSEIINSLKIDNKRLRSIGSIQSETIYRLEGSLKDSVVYIDSVRVDTIRCVSYEDKWLTFSGCIVKDEYDISISSRDSLLYIEHIIPKRFLCIKWGVKERRQEIISKNPSTKILDAEFIRIMH